MYVKDPEDKVLDVCELVMNELETGSEQDRYELLLVFLVICERARHEL